MPATWVFRREGSSPINYYRGYNSYLPVGIQHLVSYSPLFLCQFFHHYNCSSCLCNSICTVATKSQLLKLFTANIYTVAISEICICEWMMDGSGSDPRDPAG